MNPDLLEQSIGRGAVIYYLLQNVTIIVLVNGVAVARWERERTIYQVKVVDDGMKRLQEVEGQDLAILRGLFHCSRVQGVLGPLGASDS